MVASRATKKTFIFSDKSYFFGSPNKITTDHLD